MKKEIDLLTIKDVEELLSLIKYWDNSFFYTIKFIEGTFPMELLVDLMSLYSIINFEIKLYKDDVLKMRFQQSLYKYKTELYNSKILNNFILFSKLFSISVGDERAIKIIKKLRRINNSRKIFHISKDKRVVNYEINEEFMQVNFFRNWKDIFNTESKINDFMFNFLKFNDEKNINNLLKCEYTDLNRQPIYNWKANELISIFMKKIFKNKIERSINSWIYINFVEKFKIGLNDKEFEFKDLNSKKLCFNNNNNNIIMITGQLREHDYLEKLKNIRDKTKDIKNVKYYLTFWNKATVQSDLISRLDNNFDWTFRISKVKYPIPNSIKLKKDLEKELPKTFEKIFTWEKKECINEDEIKKIFPNSILTIYDEELFDQNYYKFPDLKTRNHSLNQFKMIYLISETLDIIKKNSDQNSNILKIRPETILVNHLKDNIFTDNFYLYFGCIEGALVQDAEFAGTFNLIDQYINKYFKLILNNKSFKIFSSFDKNVFSDSHNLLKLIMLNERIIYKDITLNTKYRRKPIFEMFDFKLPNVSKELFSDLNNSDLSDQEIASIRSYFEEWNKFS